MERKEAGAANATINRELACLKRAFHLAADARKVGFVPPIKMLKEAPARSGFFEADQFAAVVAKLPVDLKPLAQVAYITGWRVPSELAQLNSGPESAVNDRRGHDQRRARTAEHDPPGDVLATEPFALALRRSADHEKVVGTRPERFEDLVHDQPLAHDQRARVPAWARAAWAACRASGGKPGAEGAGGSCGAKGKVTSEVTCR